MARHSRERVRADGRDSTAGTLAEFLERHRSRGTAFCRRLVGDSHAAEDLFQQACLRLHRRGVERLEDRPGCRALLYRTLTNLCRDHARSRLRAQARERPPEAPAPVTPDRHAESREELARLEAALEGLDARHRRALLLKVRAGFSYEEIASRMRVSVSNVGVLIHRARDRLRKALAEGGSR